MGLAIPFIFFLIKFSLYFLRYPEADSVRIIFATLGLYFNSEPYRTFLDWPERGQQGAYEKAEEKN
jgi:hypothetical protein